MSVVRVKKTTSYTVMSNHHLRDKNLSLKAKGLLSLMLSLPAEWDYTINGLVAICKENETAVKSTLKELKRFGYLQVIKRNPNETKSGRIEYEYIIYEKPMPQQDGEKQEVENLPVESLPVENRTQLSTNELITERINKDNKEKKYKKEIRHEYGEYHNVLLTDSDLAKLKAEFPSDWQARIDNLSIGIQSKGYKYKDHLATIRNWARRDGQNNKPKANTMPNGKPFIEGDLPF